MRIVYSDAYEVDIGLHVFPTIKYRVVYEMLKAQRELSEDDFVRPQPADDEDILLVHKEDYLKKWKDGSFSQAEIMRLELPYSKALFLSSLICVQGTIMASQNALEDTVGIHIGGGFHHAFPGHGEGFCVFNDIAIAIRKLQRLNLIKRAMVIDCDLHQGNGTSYIFRDDDTVFTFSIHQEENYPFPKPPSDLDIGLEDGADDERYLGCLIDNIPRILEEFKPEFIIYVAGADPYKEDQIGGLGLTMEGLRQRDKLIYENASVRNIPLCVVLAGGYAVNPKDTARIHYNTISCGIDYVARS